LIDELVSYENLESQANLQIEKWLKVPPKARAITKKLLRQNTVNNLVGNRQLETEKSWDLISKPSVQKDLGRYIEMMKAKSKK
jgi:3,2-trans-enoyl-CoA isomerase